MMSCVNCGTERGRLQRAQIEHSIGPVWEANHV